ncbi:MAG: hypothetical protein JW791_02265 [Nanoarchaeota archaeon]|nr:hypothetical protein [Nanoarchaeota archaeon]
MASLVINGMSIDDLLEGHENDKHDPKVSFNANVDNARDKESLKKVFNQYIRNTPDLHRQGMSTVDIYDLVDGFIDNHSLEEGKRYLREECAKYFFD